MSRRIKEGVMTVEASFVVPIVIFTIVSLAYICIYLCDSAMAAGIIDRHINTARIDYTSGSNTLDQLKRSIQEELSANLIGTSSIRTEIEKNNNFINVKCIGTIRIPVGWRQELSFQIDNSSSIYRPVGFIRDIRRVVEAT